MRFAMPTPKAARVAPSQTAEPGGVWAAAACGSRRPLRANIRLRAIPAKLTFANVLIYVSVRLRTLLLLAACVDPSQFSGEKGYLVNGTSVTQGAPSKTSQSSTIISTLVRMRCSAKRLWSKAFLAVSRNAEQFSNFVQYERLYAEPQPKVTPILRYRNEASISSAPKPSGCTLRLNEAAVIEKGCGIQGAR
jgi:hypothetical protein